MDIGMKNTLSGTRYAQYQNASRHRASGKGSSLYEKAVNTAKTDVRRNVEQSRLTAYDAYHSMSLKAGSKISDSNLWLQASKELQAAESDKYAISIYTNEGIKGHWRIYNKETGETIIFDPKLTSIQTDPSTGKKYLTESDWYGGFMGAWGVDSSLEEALKEFMGADELHTTDINENLTLERDKTTGIVSIKQKGAEGNGGSMIVEDEEQAKKLEELADIYLEKYPSLVETKELALGLAIGEIMGTTVRDETGFLMIGIGGMTYHNAQDPTKSWGILYSGYDSTIYSKIMEAFESGAIVGNMMSDYENWLEWLTEKEIDFKLAITEEELERLREENYSEWLRLTSLLDSDIEDDNFKIKQLNEIENIIKSPTSRWRNHTVLSDEELERSAGKESQTETRIIVKPDGSRVLVMTMNVGGMETTMSMEISKPTKAPNENMRQNAEPALNDDAVSSDSVLSDDSV